MLVHPVGDQTNIYWLHLHKRLKSLTGLHLCSGMMIWLMIIRLQKPSEDIKVSVNLR